MLRDFPVLRLYAGQQLGDKRFKLGNALVSRVDLCHNQGRSCLAFPVDPPERLPGSKVASSEARSRVRIIVLSFEDSGRQCAGHRLDAASDDNDTVTT